MPGREHDGASVTIEEDRGDSEEQMMMREDPSERRQCINNLGPMMVNRNHGKDISNEQIGLIEQNRNLVTTAIPTSEEPTVKRKTFR
ncbi:hypothetical protein Nepgr_001729 [Nepenthes gracilis]|uniref:Uncharacterized protein n=1 Tax=Nepenthes gracilis TaxID=150966 RepID=A0AAD3P6J0_NEPGR|nr:hypothetical protein Nepgr_001729 [Nepenthes gracilis]